MVMQTQIHKLLQEREEMYQRANESLTPHKNEELKEDKSLTPSQMKSNSPIEVKEESMFKKCRRTRRMASEIERHYQCPVNHCRRSYGSEGSLNQHMKLKHPGFSYIQFKEINQSPPQSGTAGNHIN